MHSDRIAPPDARACSRERVVGLGAPLTVVIRALRVDVPLLQAEVNRLLEEHDRREPTVDLKRRRSPNEHDQWHAERTAWTTMLGQLDDDRGPEVELVWPTAYAAPVLRGAVAAAEKAVEAVPPDAPTRPSLVAALESAKTTLSDFLAVDNGGLVEVNL